MRDEIVSKIIRDIKNSSFDIPVPSESTVEEALEELLQENNTYEYINSHPHILIDKINQIDKASSSKDNQVNESATKLKAIPKKSFLSSVFSWLIGLLIIFGSLVLMNQNLYGGLIALFAGLLFLPPIHNSILSLLKINIPWILKSLLILGGFLFSSSDMVASYKENYISNKESIHLDIKTKISNKDFEGASIIVNKYSGFSKDKELQELKAQALKGEEDQRLKKEKEEREIRRIAEEKEKERLELERIEQEKIRVEQEKKRIEEERIALKNQENDLLQKLEQTDKKQFDEIINLYEQLSKGSPDNETYKEGLSKFKNEKIKLITKQLKTIKSSDHEKNIELYKELLVLDSGNTKYSEKITFYEDKKQTKEREIQRQKQKEHEDIRLVGLGLKWNYQESQDKMGQGTIKQAYVSSLNDINFGFPYQGAQKADLILRKHPKHGRDVILQLDKGQFLCNSYNGCKVAVRFDQGKVITYNAAGASDNSSNVIFIRNYKSFTARAKKSKELFIQAEFYQEGSIVMEFNSEGLKF